jgi:hypothetical protein
MREPKMTCNSQMHLFNGSTADSKFSNIDSFHLHIGARRIKGSGAEGNSGFWDRILRAIDRRTNGALCERETASDGR